MNYAILCLLLITISFGCFFGAYTEVKNLQYSDSDTEQKCNSLHNTNLKEGDNCGVWDSAGGNQCRKGIVSNGVCISKGAVLPLILMILSGVFFIAFIVFMIIAIKYRH
jgi:hypothetical protein